MDLSNNNDLFLPSLYSIQRGKKGGGFSFSAGYYMPHDFYRTPDGIVSDAGEELKITLMDECGPLDIPLRPWGATNSESATAIHEYWHRRLFRGFKGYENLPKKEQEHLCFRFANAYRRLLKLNRKKHYTPFEWIYKKTGKFYNEKIIAERYSN